MVRINTKTHGKDTEIKNPVDEVSIPHNSSNNNHQNTKNTPITNVNQTLNSKPSNEEEIMNITKMDPETPEQILNNTTKLNSLFSGYIINDDLNYKKKEQIIFELIENHNCNFSELDKDIAEFLLLETVIRIENGHSNSYRYLDIFKQLLKNKNIDINKTYNGYPLLLNAIVSFFPPYPVATNQFMEKYETYQPIPPNKKIHKEALKSLLAHPKLDINIISENEENDGFTALMLAVYSNRKYLVEELLKHKNINPNIQNRNLLHSAISYAIDLNRYDICKLLLKDEKIDLNCKFPGEGFTTLDFLILHIREIYKKLIDVNNEIKINLSESDILSLNKDNERLRKEPLEYQKIISENEDELFHLGYNIKEDIKKYKNKNKIKIDKNNQPIYKEILDFGKETINDIDLVNKIKEYKLKHLKTKWLYINKRYQDNIEILKLFLNHKNLDINLQTDVHKYTAIACFANLINDPEILKLFLHHKNLILSDDIKGNSILEFPITHGYYQLVEILLKDPRIDKNHKNKKGETALDIVKDILADIDSNNEKTEEEKQNLKLSYQKIMSLLE